MYDGTGTTILDDDTGALDWDTTGRTGRRYRMSRDQLRQGVNIAKTLFATYNGIKGTIKAIPAFFQTIAGDVEDVVDVVQGVKTANWRSNEEKAKVLASDTSVRPEYNANKSFEYAVMGVSPAISEVQ